MEEGCSCSIDTKNFSMKVLTALFDIELTHDICKCHCNGVCLDEIVEHMMAQFETDGDVQAQVLISLKQLVHKGFISKQNSKYKIVGPMARILSMRHDNQHRKQEIQRVREIFTLKQYVIGSNNNLTQRQEFPYNAERDTEIKLKKPSNRGSVSRECNMENNKKEQLEKTSSSPIFRNYEEPILHSTKKESDTKNEQPEKPLESPVPHNCDTTKNETDAKKVKSEEF